MRITDRLKAEHGVFLRHDHSELEDRVLYPALSRVRRSGAPGEHARLREMSDVILAGGAAADVAGYARLAREHFEHEIHGVFVMAEEWLEDDELERMANWNVDHTFEETGRPAPWKEKP